MDGMNRDPSPKVVLALLLALLVSSLPVGFSLDWSPDNGLTWNSQVDNMPSLVKTTGGGIWVFWQSDRNGNMEIYYKTYNPSAVHSWSSETSLTNDPNTDMTPSAIQASNGWIWLVWASNRTGDFEIYYKVHDGLSWLADRRLTYNASRDEFPSVAEAIDGKIWVVWDSSRLLGGWEIFYATTSDNGANWTPDAPILFPPKSGNWDPAIMRAADGKLWLVYTAADDDIYYSTYTGTWLTPRALTSDPLEDYHPSLIQTGDGKIWALWDSNRLSNQTDIYYDTYVGGSWTGETRMTTNSSNDMAPSGVDVSGVVWIAWGSIRDGNWNIYYRNSVAPPLHDVELFSVIPNMTVVTSGSAVNVEVVARNKGNSSESLEIKVFANSNLLDTRYVNLAAGKLHPLNVTWSTTGFPLGNYYINATITPVPGEATTADNTFIFSPIKLVKAPVAEFTYSPLYPVPNEIITFDASGSTPNGGVISSYRWDFGDGNVTTVADPVVTHVYATFNSYRVLLTITDSEGPTATTSKWISVHIHDVAIIWGNSYWDKTPQGLNVPYDVTVTNFGTGQESFDVVVYFNNSVVGTTPVIINSGQVLENLEVWGDSSRVAPGSYLVKATVGPLGGETNTGDNTWNFTGSIWVYVLDLGVTGLAPSKVKEYVGNTITVNVTVRNEGTVGAHGTLTLYYNNTAIESRSILVSSGGQSVFVFSWNLTNVAPGYYFLKAEVVTQEGGLIELDMDDNMFTHYWMQVKIPGDVNGDKMVNSVDLSTLKDAYGSSAGSATWNPDCDINLDSTVDILDLLLLGENYGRSNP